MGEAKEVKLLDFLYRDLARIESLYAQLFKGSVQEIQRSTSLSNETANHLGGSIKLVSGNVNSRENVTQSTQEKLNPHDKRILDILNILNLSCYTNPITEVDGKIVLLKGTIKIRDYSSIKELYSSLITDKSFNGSMLKGMKKDERANASLGMNLIFSMLQIIPLGLELEISTAYHSSIMGVVRPEYLTETPSDLLRIYGINIPGEWSILGIINTIAPQSQTTPETYNESNINVREAIDGFSNSLRPLFSANSNNLVIPIAIYRELSL